MRKILARGAMLLGGLLIVAAIATAYLLGSHAIPEHSSYQLDLATLRRLADEKKGALPTELNAAVAAEGMAPAAMFLGGLRFDRHRLVFPAYQITYPDAGAIVVDAPPGRQFFATSFPGKFNQDSFDAIQQAMEHARAIVITHEHADHLGGIAQSPALASFAPQLKLTSEQCDDRKWLDQAKFPEAVRTALDPLRYDHYYPLAPGVVLIKAPGHTPGSQMVYVRLASGAEYILVGDVAWDMEQITTPRCRPRLAELFMRENGDQVTDELRTLHDLKRANPSVHLVVSHDAKQLDDYENGGLMGGRFAGPP